MIKNNGCRMGQVSMEVIILLAVIMILFSMVMVQVSSKNNQIRLRGELYKKKIVCHQVANAISALYVAGPLSRVNVSLSYGYNVTVTDRVSTPRITSALLDGYDAVWIFSTNSDPSPEGCFLQSEIDVIMDFHNEGKGLLIAAEHETPGVCYYNADANQISIPLGVELHGNVYHCPPSTPVSIDPTLGLENHPLIYCINTIVASNSESNIETSGNTEVVVKHNGYNIIAFLDDFGSE